MQAGGGDIEVARDDGEENDGCLKGKGLALLEMWEGRERGRERETYIHEAGASCGGYNGDAAGLRKGKWRAVISRFGIIDLLCLFSRRLLADLGAGLGNGGCRESFNLRCLRVRGHGWRRF